MAASLLSHHSCCLLGDGPWCPAGSRDGGPPYGQHPQLPLSSPAFSAPLSTGGLGAGHPFSRDVSCSGERCLAVERWCGNSLRLRPGAAWSLLNRLAGVRFHRQHGVWQEKNSKFLLNSCLPLPERSQQKKEIQKQSCTWFSILKYFHCG